MVNAHKLGLRLQWWPAGVPVGGLLVGVTGVEHGSLVKGTTCKLKADGQAPREATGNRQSRVTRQVEGPGVLGQGSYGADGSPIDLEILSADSRCDDGLHGARLKVHVPEKLLSLVSIYRPAPEGPQVVGARDK